MGVNKLFTPLAVTIISVGPRRESPPRASGTLSLSPLMPQNQWDGSTDRVSPPDDLDSTIDILGRAVLNLMSSPQGIS